MKRIRTPTIILGVAPPSPGSQKAPGVVPTNGVEWQGSRYRLVAEAPTPKKKSDPPKGRL